MIFNVNLNSPQFVKKIVDCVNFSAIFSDIISNGREDTHSYFLLHFHCLKGKCLWLITRIKKRDLLTKILNKNILNGVNLFKRKNENILPKIYKKDNQYNVISSTKTITSRSEEVLGDYALLIFQVKTISHKKNTPVIFYYKNVLSDD